MIHSPCRGLVAATAASLLVGCASHVRLSPEPMGNQFSAYEDGIRSLGSNAGGSLVMLKPLAAIVGKCGTFVVTVKNKSSRPGERAIEASGNARRWLG